MNNFYKYVAEAKIQNNLDIVGQAVGYIPVTNLMNKTTSLAAAIILSMRDGNELHNVVIAVRDVYGLGLPAEEAFSFWCGDHYLEGRRPREDETTRANASIARMACYPHTENARSLLTGTQTSIAREVKAAYRLLAGPTAPCDFWVQWRRERTLCRHTQHALATLRESMPNFKEYLEAKLKEALEAFPEYSKSAIPALTGEKPVANESSDYVLPAAVSQQLLKNASSLVNLGLSLENFVVTEEHGMDYVLLTAYESASSKEPAGCVRIQYYANEAQARKARTVASGLRHGQEVSQIQVLNSGQVIADGDVAKFIQAARNFLTYSVIP